MNPRISIVIVTYKPTPVTHLCFWSLEQCHLKNSEVIVIDNSGKNQFTLELEEHFPFIQFFRNKKNEGFGKACNKGFQHSKGEIILFLNPDTIVPTDLEKKLISFFRKHPSAGAMGVKMIDASGEFLPESKRNFPTPMASFLKLSGLSSFINPLKKKWNYYANQLSPNLPGQVQVLSGAFMAVTRSALERTGGFDPRFFLYAEDIDLSYQISEKGFENWYNPEITVVHLKGETSLTDKDYSQYFFDSMIEFYKKHFSLKHSKFKQFSTISIIKAIRFFSENGHKMKLKTKVPVQKELLLHRESSTNTINLLQKKTKIKFIAATEENSKDINHLISTSEIRPSELIALIYNSKGQNIKYLIFIQNSGWLLQLNGKNTPCRSVLKTAVN